MRRANVSRKRAQYGLGRQDRRERSFRRMCFVVALAIEIPDALCCPEPRAARGSVGDETTISTFACQPIAAASTDSRNACETGASPSAGLPQLLDMMRLVARENICEGAHADRIPVRRPHPRPGRRIQAAPERHGGMAHRHIVATTSANVRDSKSAAATYASRSAPGSGVGSLRAMRSARYEKMRSLSARCPTISITLHSFGAGRHRACSGLKGAKNAAVSAI